MSDDQQRRTPRSLGADVDRLPEIPIELAAWIATLLPKGERG